MSEMCKTNTDSPVKRSNWQCWEVLFTKVWCIALHTSLSFILSFLSQPDTSYKQKFVLRSRHMSIDSLFEIHVP
jgi:hypothetical protein